MGRQRGDGGSGDAALRRARFRLRRARLGEGLTCAAGDQRAETCEPSAGAAAKSDLV